MAGAAAGFQCVVKIAERPGGLDVDGSFLRKLVLLEGGDERKRVDAQVRVRERDIDEVRIRDRALSAKEIKATATAQRAGTVVSPAAQTPRPRPRPQLAEARQGTYENCRGGYCLPARGSCA